MSENGKKSSYKRPGIIFPLIIIAIGVILLLQNLGVLSDNVWDTLWKCWPVLFILIGVDSLLKREGVAGPVFFIRGGIIFLLSNFGLLAWSAWDLLFQLWPVLLIAWGLDLVIGKRSWWGSLLALVLLAAIVFGVIALGGLVSPPESQAIDWSPDGEVTSLEASISPAVGSLDVDDIASGDELITGTVNYRKGSSIKEHKSINNEVATYSLSFSGTTIFNPINQSSLPDWQVNFSQDIPLDMNVSMGAGDVNLDLSNLQLTDLRVEVGVGRSEITLPNESLTARLENGVGETILYIPKAASVVINADTALATLSVPKDFDQTRDGVYEYQPDKSDSPQITIDVEQAIGRVVVKLVP